MLKTARLFLFVPLLVLAAACEENYAPKPTAYIRIDLPGHRYISSDSAKWSCPYSFEFSAYSRVTVDPRYKDSTCWYNIYYPDYRATIHLTYNELNGDLATRIEENRNLAMKHITMAEGIDEISIHRDSAKVYGIAYDFSGQTASDYQFFLTDSTNHFLRGALYFNVEPNKDSLRPVTDFIKEDIRHFMGTLRWN